MIEYPLTKANRIRLAQAFRHNRRVDLSIDCVLEGQMGLAFVDDAAQPSAFKLQVGPFCYFAGSATSPGGRGMIQNLPPYSLLMPSPAPWIQGAQEVYGRRLVPTTRYSFSSASLSLDHLDRLLEGSLFRDQVQRIDTDLATRIWHEPEHMVDISDFDSPEDFAQRGVGFCLLDQTADDGDGFAAAAYSSLVCSQGIEVSLYVLPDYRRQGVATTLGCELLKHCLEHNMEPHWDAANPESCTLAEKLGYVPAEEYVAHFLTE